MTLVDQNGNEIQKKPKKIPKKQALILNKKIRTLRSDYSEIKPKNRYVSNFGFIGNRENNGASGLYIPFGVNKDYFDLEPMFLISLAKESSTLASALKLTKKFLVGDGFADKNIQNIVINDEGKTMSDLLEYLAVQMAYFESMSFHVNYNTALQIDAINFLQFERLRREQPDQYDKVHRICIVSFYDPYIYRTQSVNYLDFYPVFDPNPSIVLSQAEYQTGQVGSSQEAIKGYKGQIYYRFRQTPGHYWYASPDWDTIVLDAETESLIKRNKRTDTRDGMKADTIITEYGDVALDEERQESLRKSYQPFLDVDGSRVMVRTVINKDNKPDIDILDTIRDSKKKYEYLEDSVKQNIRSKFGFPDILYGFAQAGKLGNMQEFQDAVNWGNIITSNDRKMIERTLREVFKYHSNPSLRDSDFRILEFSSNY